MVISKADSKKMQTLAKEGKLISHIVSEDFPHLDYIDVVLSELSVGAE